MPKVFVKVISNRKDADGKIFAEIQCNKVMPNKGEYATLKWGSTRSIAQNSLYWVYLHWVINEGGLSDQGHFSEQALHENLKAHFVAEKIFTKGEFKAIEEATTATMNKTEFGEYFQKVDDFINEFFETSTAPFWDIHKEHYSME